MTITTKSIKSIPSDLPAVLDEYRRQVEEATRNGHSTPHYVARDLLVKAYKLLLSAGFDVDEAVAIVKERLGET